MFIPQMCKKPTVVYLKLKSQSLLEMTVNRRQDSSSPNW